VKPKKESKLFGLEFEPESAFDNLRSVARKVLDINKVEFERRLARDKRRKNGAHSRKPFGT
jgi:hypothetical protein